MRRTEDETINLSKLPTPTRVDPICLEEVATTLKSDPTPLGFLHLREEVATHCVGEAAVPPRCTVDVGAAFKERKVTEMLPVVGTLEPRDGRARVTTSQETRETSDLKFF